ncbi:hypothetical protein PGT21_014974 [Puccinia graminis f. sp. tritici]|uniref:Zn(2)-C6 fungal-type domain-containing protein n=1 Tax=Puccinia graminis f. sp. tritici TaxID=56615 RepID=A0A5B0RP03_PUCGR|nr:hypothetical protein PGT21_013768 [Puccinia graminis f. sp. tritici]KAA1076662.1 hypothetical protein PGT21_014974 [Puccinia graminis f. sp. tritici]KAA1126825.1 hypothetical protein PGTUg99_025538 [Puccinia graminis f. sp. tritici]
MSNNLGASFTKLPRPPQRPPACRACKRRKSKCDFEQPCSTCMLHSTVDNCCYDTLAVPRDHRSTARICPSAPSRTKQAKTLKARLAEAESMIMAQQHTIESLRAAANTMAQSSTSHSDLHGPNDFRAVQDDAKDREGDDTTGREEDGKTHPEDLADKMTRLVIGSAISPLQLEVPELPNSIATPERTTNGEAQKLQNHVRALLVSHNNGWVEFARRFGLNPSHAAPLPPPPLVSNTIIPEKETINSVHGLVSLFPPTKVEALALLENYLSFVNLVHHVVDGPQTRFEIEFFYDLLLLDPPQPMKPSPMPVPPLLEPGWLSAMLAIFTLADKSDRGGLLRPNSPQSLSDSQRADGKSKIWLEGSLQGLRMRLSGETPLDLVALRSVCLVVWVYVLYGQDDEVLPAVNLNSKVLYQACDKLQLHRDPSQVEPQLSQREAEDRRRIFYNLLNTDWLFSAISGKTYSPVGERGHDVRLPRSITDRDPIPSAISGLAFRSRLMRQLRKLATLALLPGGISQADAANFEAELDRLDQRLPGWCEIDVDNFPSGQSLSDPQQQAEFSQKIITNVQLCAVRVRFHTKFASPGLEAPTYMHQSAGHHRAICITRAVRLLRLEQLHLQYSTRILGHSGYPRFHPIVGGLTLSALMAKSSDPSERRMLFDELSRFTAVIHGYGVLSQVTNLGILAIETALAEVRRGELEPRTLRIPASTVSQAQNEENSTEPYYAAPLIPETVPYDRRQGVEPQSERPPLAPRQSEHIQHPYRPTPIIIPADGLSKQTNLRKQPEVCLQQPANVYDVLLSERVVRRGDSDQVEPASAISPITPSGNDFGQYAITPGQTHVINPIGNLFSHLGGVGYEGLMVGWMGSGISTPATGNQSSETVIPTVQNAWKQEW